MVDRENHVEGQNHLTFHWNNNIFSYDRSEKRNEILTIFPEEKCRDLASLFSPTNENQSNEHNMKTLLQIIVGDRESSFDAVWALTNNNWCFSCFSKSEFELRSDHKKGSIYSAGNKKKKIIDIDIPLLTSTPAQIKFLRSFLTNRPAAVGQTSFKEYNVGFSTVLTRLRQGNYETSYDEESINLLCRLLLTEHDLSEDICLDIKQEFRLLLNESKKNDSKKNYCKDVVCPHYRIGSRAIVSKSNDASEQISLHTSNVLGSKINSRTLSRGISAGKRSFRKSNQYLHIKNKTLKSDNTEENGIYPSTLYQATDNTEKQAKGQINASGKCKNSNIIENADKVASKIAGTALWVERGLASSVPLINSYLDHAGNLAKDNITPLQSEFKEVRGDDIVALSYADGAKHATAKMRQATWKATFGLRDAATNAINKVSEIVEENHLGAKIIKRKQDREALSATGKIVLASLGAAGIIGQALYVTTRDVSKKSLTVTADVVRHKYGDHSGKIVEDTGEIIGNTVRTIKLLTLLEGPGITKLIAKNTGRVHLNKADNNLQACPLSAKPISRPARNLQPIVNATVIFV